MVLTRRDEPYDPTIDILGGVTPGTHASALDPAWDDTLMTHAALWHSTPGLMNDALWL